MKVTSADDMSACSFGRNRVVGSRFFAAIGDSFRCLALSIYPLVVSSEIFN